MQFSEQSREAGELRRTDRDHAVQFSAQSRRTGVLLVKPGRCRRPDGVTGQFSEQSRRTGVLERDQYMSRKSIERIEGFWMA